MPLSVKLLETKDGSNRRRQKNKTKRWLSINSGLHTKIRGQIFYQTCMYMYPETVMQEKKSLWWC